MRKTPVLAAARQKRMTIKMEGYGETHTSTPNTTDRARETSRVLDRPSLRRDETSVEIKTISEMFTIHF